MKKKLTKIIIIVITILLLVALYFIGYNIKKNIHEKNIKDLTWIKNNVVIKESSELGTNILTVNKDKDINIFDKDYQQIISDKINNLNKDYTFDNPLLIYNPYSTNDLALNIYFNTKEESYLEYNISANKVKDFSRTLYNDSNNNLTTNHSYQLIGLVPEKENTITLTLKDKDNKEIKSKKIKINLKNIKAASEIVLEQQQGPSDEELSSGLYTILGNDSDEQDYVFMYDNFGVIRSQMPIIGYRAHAILFKDDSMYFSISQTKIAKMNNQGQITDIYKTGKYYLHHDYTFDDDGNLLVLANDTKKDTEEDCIIKINLETHEVSEVIDFKKIFKSYVDTCTLDTKSIRDEGEDGLDWLHLNSIEYDNGDVILSSRETSSIIKVENINSNPQIKYILADQKLWEDTEFSKYVYKKSGDFKIQAGQHSVRIKEKVSDNDYYLILFNNNFGNANSQPDFDYSTIGITNNNAFKGDNSYYYVYRVNEKKKTFSLVNSIQVPYSGIVSSVQIKDNNVIIDSGTQGIFLEYDENNQLIKQFKTKMNKYMVYRVYKYDFNNFYFKD